MKRILIFSLFSIFCLIGISQERLNVGDKASTFALKNVNGKMVSTSDAVYADAKGFIVTFTCNSCPWAKLYENRINDLNKKYASKGYPVIAIQPNATELKPEDSFENMVARSEDKGYTFPYLIDETQEVAHAYGARKTPDIFVVEKVADELIVRYIGGIDDSPSDPAGVNEKFVEAAVDALLAGKSVSKEVTRAIGCSVKYRKS